MYSSVNSWVRPAAESARPALTPAFMVSLILSANSSKADRLFIGNITPTGRFLLVTTTASRCAESRNAPKAFCASLEEIVFTLIFSRLVVNIAIIATLEIIQKKVICTLQRPETGWNTESLTDTECRENPAQEFVRREFAGDFRQRRLRQTQLLREQFAGAGRGQGLAATGKMLRGPA